MTSIGLPGGSLRSLLSRSTVARGDFVLRHRCVEAPDVSLLSGVVSAQSIFTCAGTKTRNWASYLQVLVSPFYMKSFRLGENSELGVISGSPVLKSIFTSQGASQTQNWASYLPPLPPRN